MHASLSLPTVSRIPGKALFSAVWKPECLTELMITNKASTFSSLKPHILKAPSFVENITTNYIQNYVR